jgi:hypothetical protein
MGRVLEPPKKPWDAFDPDTAKPSGQDELYRAIGFANSSWSLVEHELSRLFLKFFVGQKGYAAWKLYGSFPSTASRISALKTVAEASFLDDKERLDLLNELIDGLVQKFITRRNHIAHGIVSAPDSDGNSLLIEPPHNLKHKDMVLGRTGYRLDAQQITHYGENFRYLAVELSWNGMLIFWNRPQPFPGSLPDTPLTPYIRPTRERLQKRLTQK